jgi:hypothetical protein
MICPKCKAEYREGFTECADCEVELVSSLAKAYLGEPEESREGSGVCDQLLWSGTDVDFYLSLITALEGQRMARLGRAMRPVSAGESGEKSQYSFDMPEFGVWTAEKDLFLARWITKSLEEDRAQNAEHLRTQTEENVPDPDDEDFPEGWKCVLCRARFAEDSSPCPNCGLALRRSGEILKAEEDGRTVSYLPNPNFASALRAELGKLGIPFNNVKLSCGNILIGRYRPVSYDVTVLGKDYEPAQEVFTRLLREWEFVEGLGLGSSSEVLRTYLPVRVEENRWVPEDLTKEVWEGTHYFQLIGVCHALREHEIPYTLEIAPPGSAKVLLHPEDEPEAKAIIREIEAGIPAE